MASVAAIILANLEILLAGTLGKVAFGLGLTFDGLRVGQSVSCRRQDVGWPI